MSVQVLARAAVRTYRFRIEDHPHALQASLSFEAYGNFPMRGLQFRFYEPDGALVHEIRPAQGWSPKHGMLSRIRKLPLVLRMEHLLRKMLHRNIFFRLDLPPACLAYPQLTVSVENVSGGAIAVRGFRLSTSTLAPDRPEQNLHSIEGYSDRISVFPGESLQLFVHAPLLRFGLTVIRRGARDRSMLHIGEIEGKPQHYAANAYEQGARWDPTFRLEVGADWPGGMYVASISDSSGAAFEITFIVKKPRLGVGAGLAVLASTNTWQAYNTWGGASLYRYEIDDGLGKQHVCRVHMQRPNPGASTAGDEGHLANTEKHVLRWLEQNGVAYDLYADIDLHDDPDLLLEYQTLLINTHGEYWTDPMYSGLENFLDEGGNLIYLSANGLYWKTEIHAQQIEVKHDNTAHSFSGEPGGRWRDCGRLEPKLLGIRFTWAGSRSLGKPYKVITPQHWIFDGTGVEKGSLIGATGLNMGGASGWELDTIDRRNKPAGLVHLAKGTNRWRNGADMTYFTHPGGGGVFSVGSITFGGSLAIDPVLTRMVRNVIAKFSQKDRSGDLLAAYANGRASPHADHAGLDLPH
ncbi:MAG: N,N-dimethylformamidase beta subunit family domain-containing protein [Telluria sp.]